MKKFILSMLALCVSLFTFADEVTFDWSTITTTQTPTEENVYTQAPITLTFGKGTGSNLPAENKEGSIRMYAGSTLTITAEEGYVVSHVEFTSTGTKYTAANLTCTIDGTEGLVADSWDVPTAQQELVLNAGANARFKTIVVTYEAVAVPNVKKPTFSVAAGTYYDAQAVEIASATEGATIQYNTDGATWQDYTAAVTIDKTCTLSARAILDPDTSSVASAAYVIAENYASLSDLCNAEPASQPVIVTLSNVKIDSLYTYKSTVKGIYLTSGNENHQQVLIYCNTAVPEGWAAGGFVSGTVKGPWKQYSNGAGNPALWEVCPDNWDALTYFYPPVADGNYYIQNKESGLYMSGANDWGTRASATVDGEMFTATLSNGAYTLLDTALSSTAKNLGSNLYTDSNAEAWTIESVEGEEGVYTIKNGAGYIAQGDAGAVIGNVLAQVSEVTEAAKWRFLTKDEAVAQIKAENAPVNASFLIGNPNFGRNHNTSVWTVNASNKNLAGGANNNMCAESWRSAFDINQTLTVPNGIYTLTAQAALTDYTNAYDGANYPVVYANEKSSVFNEMVESDRGTSMGTLSTAFTAGNYAVTVDSVIVTDGTLKIGIKGTRTDTWCIWDNFQVTFIGDVPLDNYQTALAEALTKAQALVDADMNAEVLSALNTAIADNTTPAEETVDAYSASIAAVTAATEAAQTSADIYAAVAAKVATLDEAGKAAFEASETGSKYVAKTLVDEDVTADYVAAVKAQTSAGADMTGAIVNPSFEEGSLNGWTSTDGGNVANNGNFSKATGTWFVERWAWSATGLSDGSLSQTVTGLPAGTYTLSAEMHNYQQVDATVTPGGYYLVANTDSVEVSKVDSTYTVTFTLEEGQDLNIAAALVGCTGNWVCVDNFRLTLNELTPTSTLLNTFVAASISGNALSSDVRATFEEWSDHIVIKSFDGVEGHDLNIGFDDTAYTTINGEENPWIEFTDATYWGGYFYPGYTGGNWDENGGQFWVGAYVYDSDNNYAWKYFYYNLCKDYTSSIVNADLATTDAWDQTETKGISGNLCKVSSGKVFDFSQTINLPAGKYQLTANAAYRYSGSEADEYTAIAAGTETHLAKLYATTATYDYVGDVKNRYEGATDAALDGTSAVEVNGKYVPNSSADVQTYMNAGQYVNNVVFNVQEDGAVKIGIRKTESPEAGDYTVIGTWSLLRLGDAEADPSPETVDIAGTWYENTTGMYYGSDWEDFSLTDNEVTVAVEGTTATFTGLLGDTANGLIATIDGNTLTFTKGQTIAYGGYDWELGTEDSDGAEADLVGTISEDGKTITLNGINIFYSGYSYMYNTQVTLTRDKAVEPEPETGDIVADRTNWTITAPNTCPSNYEGTYDGNIAAAIDASTTTFYHSDWSGSSLTDGNDGLQGFLIDMSESIDVLGFSYAARGNSTSGHATAYRLYAYNELPACLAHIDSLTSENKDVVLGADNAELGTPVSQSGDILFTYAAKTDIQTVGFPTTNARYVLFVQDKGTDAWLTCSDFNLYTAMDKREYTVTSNKEDGGITYDGAAVEGTLTVDGAIDLGKVQIVEKEGYEVAVTMNGTAITVAYTNVLVPDMAALLATAEAEYAAGNTYTYSDGLITSVDQLSSPYTEPNEGSLANLLDGSSTTFWHSAWSAGSVDDGVHYLEIALPENTTGDIELDLTRRSNASNDHLTKADIIGVNADGTTEVVATVDLPFGSATETVKATFTLDKAYSSIRILEKTTTTGRGYWHAGEIQLYQIVLTDTCLNALNPEEAAAMAAAIEAAKAVADDPSQADIDALQAAYDAYHDALYPVFDYVYEGYVGSYYEGAAVDVNLTAILKKIGAADMTNVTVYSEEPDGTRTNSVRGNTDGWRDATGKFVSWGADAYFYVQDNSELPGAQYYVGGYPGKTDEPCSFTATLVYVNNDTQAEKAITITLNYVEAPEVEIAAVDSVEATVEYSYTEGSYTEKIVTLTDDQVSQICTALGLSALSEATVYGYNPTTQEYLASYATYDGWRDANGDFANWAGNSDVPFCVKYTDGQNYYCYNIEKCWQSAACYWAIANDKNEAVLVKITFTYTDVPTNINGVDANENATIYNLNGVKLNKMQRGINIVNGVKVIKK